MTHMLKNLNSSEISLLKLVSRSWNKFINKDETLKNITIFHSILSAAKNKAHISNVPTEKTDRQLLDIVKVEALDDLSEASKTAQTIQNHTIRSMALSIIRKAGSPDAFIERDQELEQTAGKKITYANLETAYLEIIKSQVQINPEEAKKIAKKISDTNLRDLAYLEIIKIEAQISPEKAKQTAQALEDPDFKFQALLLIAKLIRI